jgi:glycosyltransferase involved in cell wall biosynthesis
VLHHGIYILSTHPLIISTISGYPYTTKLPYKRFVTHLPEMSLPAWFRPKYVIEHVAGWSAPIYRMAKFKARQIAHTLEGREHHLMINAQDEDQTRKSFLVRGAHFSANIYVNEHLYHPLNEPKLYDAIYTAQLAPFKRHQLAQKIERLMIISYGGDLHAFCPELQHAEYNREFLPRPELARKYNQSYVGLCLSAKEGAMLAACEYLLCGIPIVSTPSKGGRDEFFDDRTSIVVAPDPEKIAEAVQRWKDLSPDPKYIRGVVLQRMNSIRRDYCAYIARLIQKGGGGKKNPELLMEKYFSGANGIAGRFIKFEDLHNVDLEKFAL